MTITMTRQDEASGIDYATRVERTFHGVAESVVKAAAACAEVQSISMEAAKLLSWLDLLNLSVRVLARVCVRACVRAAVARDAASG